MSTIRIRLVVSSAIGCLLLMAIAVSARSQQTPAPDPERGFGFGDTNLDGKLSFDEFRELIRNPLRLKKAGAKKANVPLGPVFRRLDRDGDGFLTIQEFRRVNELRKAAAAQKGLGPMAKGMLGPLAKAAVAMKKAAAGKSASRADSRAVAARRAASKPVTPDQAKFFETRIRPVLMTTCAKCHGRGAEKVKGGLRVDSPEGLLKGGDTGPAVVPGNVDESLLITAIRYKDESLQMPPKTKLPDEVVADFEKWVKMGRPTHAARKQPLHEPSTWRKDGNSGHFSRPGSSARPESKIAPGPNPTSTAFCWLRLEAKGLPPRADADRHTLLRRVSFDLTGLPPSPEDVAAYLADQSAGASPRSSTAC